MVCREGIFLLVPIGLWLLYSIDRMHRKSIPETMLIEINGLDLRTKVKAFAETLLFDVILLSPLFQTSKLRWLKHTLIFWGSIAILMGATLLYLFGPAVNSTPPDDLLWLLFNGGVVSVLSGALLAAVRVLAYRKEEVTEPWADPVFVVFLGLAVGTGFLMKRWGSVELGVTLGFTVYAAHLISVALCIVPLPFTRFYHSGVAPYMKFFDRLQAVVVERSRLKDYKGNIQKERRVADYAVKKIDSTSQSSSPS